MRTAIRAKAAPQSQSSFSKTWPAPIGGWNDRDALAQMKRTDAVALDNWMPKTSYCEIRGGHTTDANSATGMTGNGKTLVVYNGMNGTDSMFCSTASGVYDVSSVGAVGASVASRTNGKHRWTMFGDGTTQYLIMVNGVDAPLYYDGTTWLAVTGISSPALTGLTTTLIIGVNVFKNRLFFIEKDSLSFWYLAAGAAGGALTEFSLNGVAQKGGYLVAMGTQSVDGGDGPDDRAVFITSEGEVIVYVGNNPSSASAWGMVGRYFIGTPLGRRCLVNYGSDLVLLTQNGAFPLSTALQSAVIDYKDALSNKIENAFTTSARLYGSEFGWCGTLYPAQGALIFNAPVDEDGIHYQYVMNTITKSWCRFIGWDAEDFCVYNGDLYFTTSNKVVKAWTGQVDGTNNINAYGKTAFTDFGSSDQKQFVMFCPVLAVNGNLNFLTDIDVDFKDTLITGTATYSVTSGALWDVDDWNEGYWASGLEILRDWTSPDEYTGVYASAKIKVATNALTIQWMANNMIYKTGAIF